MQPLLLYLGGVAWQKGADFVNTVYFHGNRLDKLDEDIAGLKKNLGDLGTTPYEMELASDGGAAMCELGRVVIGIIRDNQRILVRCASVGRAAWNPNSPPGSLDPNLYLVKSVKPYPSGTDVQVSPHFQNIEKQAASSSK